MHGSMNIKKKLINNNCALLGCYATSTFNSLRTFRNNLSFQSSGIKKIRPIGCPETSVRNYQYSLRNNPEEEFDIHGSVHHNTILIKMTNKMKLCRIIYYSIVPWLVYMFRAILSLETCRRTKEKWNHKLSYTVSSCLSFL